MDKAILILDMPENCYHCQLVDSEYDICLGMVTDDMPAYEVKKYKCPDCYRHPKRPDWCPLIKLPDRNPDREVLFSGKSFTMEDINDAFKLGEDTGWNAFIDYLEGKT